MIASEEFLLFPTIHIKSAAKAYAKRKAKDNWNIKENNRRLSIYEINCFPLDENSFLSNIKEI